jgi:hypothetical protein
MISLRAAVSLIEIAVIFTEAINVHFAAIFGHFYEASISISCLDLYDQMMSSVKCIVLSGAL